MMTTRTAAPVPERLRVLHVNASGRRNGSATRALSAELVAALGRHYAHLEVTERDLADGLPFVDQTWIEASFTRAPDRDASQRAALSFSDALVDELREAHVLVVGMPIYNFGVPAVLKAWVDMVSRAGETFRYSNRGPEGLLAGTRAYLVVASGGVGVDSPGDFATPYMRHVLSFLGIDDVEVIAATGLNAGAPDPIATARTQITNLLRDLPQLRADAA